MSWLWGTAGHSLFDQYSLLHFAWFFVLTAVAAAVVKRHLWLWALGAAVIWETFEQWAVQYLSPIPFVGREEWTNWLVGDSLSDLFGFLIALLVIRTLRRQGEEVVREKNM